jgi:hypothetical protein
MSDLEDSNTSSAGELTPGREKQLLEEEDDGGDETMEHPPPAATSPSQKDVGAVPPAVTPADSGSSTGSGSATLRRDLASSGSSTAASSATCSGLPKAYVNVRAARMAARTVRNLNGCAVTNKNTVGSFHVLNDNRIFSAHNRHCYSTKMNISASFNLENLTCNNCTFRGEHTVLSREVGGSGELDASASCFILSDQNFPPVLPAEGDGECLKIFRIEDGTLDELVTSFMELTKGFTIPAGSVVVLASASYMALVGTAAYALEFVKARSKIVRAMGGGHRGCARCLHPHVWH